jgi:hypothetical protein
MPPLHDREQGSLVDSGKAFQTSLAAQLQWAWHMSLPAIILPALSISNDGAGLSLEDAPAIYPQVLATSHRWLGWIPVRPFSTVEISSKVNGAVATIRPPLA